MRELGPDPRALHREIAEALVELDPDLLAAVGDFVPALEPYAGRAAATVCSPPPTRWLWRPDSRSASRGDEIVVLKASRGVALERILPALTASAKVDPRCSASSPLRLDVLSLARAARQDLHHLQSLQLHQLSRRGRHGDGAAARVRRGAAGHRAAAGAEGGPGHPRRRAGEPPEQARHARPWAA